MYAKVCSLQNNILYLKQSRHYRINICFCFYFINKCLYDSVYFVLNTEYCCVDCHTLVYILCTLIMFLDIIHCPFSNLKHNVSETGFCLRLQVEPTQLDPMDRDSAYFRTPAQTQDYWKLSGASPHTWGVFNILIFYIKMDLIEIESDGMDWINLAQDTDQWRALANTIMRLRVP
jgi:hypothetical protein